MRIIRSMLLGAVGGVVGYGLGLSIWWALGLAFVLVLIANLTDELIARRVVELQRGEEQ